MKIKSVDTNLIDLRNAVRRYASKNYFSDGWDILADHLDDHEIIEIIIEADAKTHEQAIEACLDFVRRQNAKRLVKIIEAKIDDIKTDLEEWSNIIDQ